MSVEFAVVWQEFYPEGYWSMPNCISSNRYHFFPGADQPSICGRWRNDQRKISVHEVRNIVPHVDCTKCAELLRTARADRGDDEEILPGRGLHPRPGIAAAPVQILMPPASFLQWSRASERSETDSARNP